MGKYWEVLGEYVDEGVAYAAFAGGGGASPHIPLKTGHLKGIRIIVGSQAAGTLIEGVLIRMTCALWSPNTQTFAVSGTGIRTAVQGNAPPTFDFPMDQPVQAGIPITLEGMNLVATAVTVSVLVNGEFEG